MCVNFFVPQKTIILKNFNKYRYFLKNHELDIFKIDFLYDFTSK